jgi:hypothetical protein
MEYCPDEAYCQGLASDECFKCLLLQTVANSVRIKSLQTKIAVVILRNVFRGFYIISGFFIFLRKDFKMHPYPLFALELLTHAGMYSDSTTEMREFKIPFWKGLDLLIIDPSWEDYYMYYQFILKIQ